MIPENEIRSRITRLRNLLREKGLEGALVISPLNLFYFTGTFAQGHLLVTEKEVRFLVFRPCDRATFETPLSVEPMNSLKKLPSILKDTGLKVLGLEFSFLTHERFLRYQELLADFELRDLSEIINTLRMQKSFYEKQCLKEAGVRLAEALATGLSRIGPGMTELEAMGTIEIELRRRGHPGVVRSLRGNEFPTGIVISGPEGLAPSYMIAGEGGKGVQGFSGGASSKHLRFGEPIMVDFSGFYAGYYVDQTRMFSLGEVSSEVKELFDLSQKILETTEKVLRPGVTAEEVYFAAQKEAERLGVEEYFMAHGEEKVNFVGHGVGLTIDELPALAPGVKTRLSPGMSLALEPKLHVPGIGVIGLEDTYFLGENSLERLTTYRKEWQVLN